jgi:hypothetical protein
MVASLASAKDVTLVFSSVLENIAYDTATPPFSVFHGIPLGTPVSGSLRYDEAPCASGCLGTGGSRTDYMFTSYSASLQAGALSLTHPTPQSNFRVAITNNGTSAPGFVSFFSALLGTPITSQTPIDAWVIASQDVVSFSNAPSFGMGFLSLDTTLYADTNYRRAPDPNQVDLVYFFIADGAFLNVYFSGGRTDLDGDGIANRTDNCPRAANADQANGDPTPRGNACQCGDQNRDGRVNVSDIVAANLAIFNPALVTALCDTNRDGLCSVADLVGINLEIFSPGETAVCGLQPCPGLALGCP